MFILGHVTLGNGSCNLCRNKIARQVARKIAQCNSTYKRDSTRMVERRAYSTTTHTSLLKAHLTFKLNKVSLIYSPQIPPLCSCMMSLHLRYIVPLHTCINYLVTSEKLLSSSLGRLTLILSVS